MVVGTKTWFKVKRGIKQGCVLGPTLFIIALEFCVRRGDLTEIGVEFKCVGRPGIPLPDDLKGVKFRLRYGGYADDIVLFGPSEEALSEALLRIQKVAGDIGLDINVGKTEWLYLNNPNKEQLEACTSRRKEAKKCCEQIKLGEDAISHVGTLSTSGL